MPEFENRFGLPLMPEANERVAQEVAEIEAIEVTPEMEAKYEGHFDHMSPEHRHSRIQILEHMERERITRDEEARAERESKDRESLERHMGGLATSLTEIFVRPEDLRHPDQVREEVLQALKPLHERISSFEWDRSEWGGV